MAPRLTFPVDVPLVECALPLGRPGLTVHNELRLSGWAVSAKGIAGIAVQIGERQWNASYGLDTPSLAARFPDVEGAARAGYHLVIDTSAWEPGPRVVTVAAFDRKGGRTAVEGEVAVHPFERRGEDIREPAAGHRDPVSLTVDSPVIEDGRAEVAGSLDIRGWALAGEGVEAVLVTLDGADHVQYEALRPIARPDLIGAMGRDAALDAGFALLVDPADVPPGDYRLTVVAIDRTGRAARIESDLTVRPAPSVARAPAKGSVEPPLPPGEEPSDADREWASRALLAEADAALCRGETRLALTGEERARLELRRAEERASARTEALNGELDAARADASGLREERDAVAAHLAALEGSASWRVTGPLRAVKRALRRPPR